MAVVRDDDAIGVELDLDQPRVGVERVLDELSKGDVRLTDESFAEFAEESGVYGEVLDRVGYPTHT